MANEIQITGAIAYAKNGISSVGRSLSAQNVTQTGNRLVERVLTVASSDTTIPVPEGTLGFAWFHNLDVAATINIKTAAGGTIILSMLPGEIAGPFRFGSGVTAPVAISSSGNVFMEYLILES